MKKIYYTAIISAAAMLCACSSSHNNKSHIQDVEVALPVIDSVTIYQTYPGILKAYREVNLVARVNGYLRTCDYSYSQPVKKNQVLFTIEDRNYRDQLEKAMSALTTAQSNLNYAETRYHAMIEAFKTDAVSKMEVGQAENALVERKAAMKSAEAGVQTARTQLSYCIVKAPFDGHISASTVDVGAYLNGEVVPVNLATIYQDNYMVTYFSVEDAGMVSRLQEYMENGALNLDSIPLTFSDSLSHNYTAKLDYIAPVVDTSTGKVELQGVVDNHYGELRSGMTVSVDLPVANAPRAILIEESAICSDKHGEFVYVVNDSNIIVRTPVQTGRPTRDNLRLITAGISSDSRYVVRDIEKVYNGLEVNPVTTTKD